MHYKMSASAINITKITQKNLAKHPMQPVMPSPRKEAITPNACTPQPSNPKMTKATTKMPINPNIPIIFKVILVFISPAKAMQIECNINQTRLVLLLRCSLPYAKVKIE